MYADPTFAWYLPHRKPIEYMNTSFRHMPAVPEVYMGIESAHRLVHEATYIGKLRQSSYIEEHRRCTGGCSVVNMALYSKSRDMIRSGQARRWWFRRTPSQKAERMGDIP